MIKYMTDVDSKLIFQLESNWGLKRFLLGANINTNSDYGYRETYLCLYLGFWNVFIGYRGLKE